MMIGHTGVRGVGKTARISLVLHQKKQSGYLCISNFTHVDTDIDCSTFTPREFYELLREIAVLKERGWETCDLFPTFKHTGVFIAIDEALLYFSSDQSSRYKTEEFQYIMKLLAQARKGDIEIEFTTQDPSKIDINFRRYTELWINWRPVFPWRRKLPFPHPTRPTVRYEVRYFLNLLWEEHHELEYANPKYNYATVRDEMGVSTLSKASTLIKTGWFFKSKMRWTPAWAFHLYDSHQMLAMKAPKRTFNTPEEEFHLLVNNLSLTAGERTSAEPYPTFKKIWNGTFGRINKKWVKISNEDKVPTRYKINPALIKLPDIEPREINKSRVVQPTKLLGSLRDISESPFRGVLPALHKVYKEKGIDSETGEVHSKEPPKGGNSTPSPSTDGQANLLHAHRRAESETGSDESRPRRAKRTARTPISAPG